MRILVVTGSSGGHIFPALAFLEALKQKCPQDECLLVLPKKIVAINAQVAGCKLEYIPSSPVKPALSLKFLFSVWDFLRSIARSIFILADFGPDAVVSFGSITSVPIVLCAWLFRVKAIIHEQNVIPGRANKFLSFFADRIAVSFLATKEYIKNSGSKIILTGNPLRRELIKVDKNQARDYFCLDHDKFTIFVTGGSQGSHRVNNSLLGALRVIKNPGKCLQVIHITGRQDYELAVDTYKQLAIEAKVFCFLEPIHYAYSASDLLVSRSGATTVSELMRFHLPAIMIPYPFAYQHQLANARILEQDGSVVIVNDKDLESGVLAEKIDYFINNPDKLTGMRLSYPKTDQDDAAGLLVDALIALF